jgi:hypothetical protein
MVASSQPVPTLRHGTEEPPQGAVAEAEWLVYVGPHPVILAAVPAGLVAACAVAAWAATVAVVAISPASSSRLSEILTPGLPMSLVHNEDARV